MQEINSVQLIDFICPDDITATEGDHKKMLLKERAKWSRLIEKKQSQKFYFSLNIPVLFLGLFLWSGIFGGVWFAYRGRLWFGAFVWPIIAIITSIATRILLFFIINYLQLTNISSNQTWVPLVSFAGSFVAQIILAIIANYFYIGWADKQVKQGKLKGNNYDKGIYALIAFGMLFLLHSTLTTITKLNINSISSLAGNSQSNVLKTDDTNKNTITPRNAKNHTQDSMNVKIIYSQDLMKNKIYDTKTLQNYLAMNEEQKRYGYVNVDSPQAQKLLYLKRMMLSSNLMDEATSPKSPNINSKKMADNQSAINKLNLAYSYIGVPASEMDMIFGISTFNADKNSKNSIEGVIQAFNKTNIGPCSYSEYNRKLAHRGEILIKELVNYEINNKPTIIQVRGTKKTGFMYDIKWFDSTFSRSLVCANPKFSQELRTEIIKLANRIDSYQRQ